jgi:PAS domain S-box-containing protein
MLRRIFTRTLIVVAIVVAAAEAADYVSNAFIFGTPAQFTPGNTGLVALIVSAPIAWYLIRQWFNLQRVKEALAASVADKDAAVIESGRRREEAELALERLRESEALYRLLADNQNDVITLWDKHGRRKYSSPSVERALGYTVAEIMNLTNTALVHPADLAMLEDVHRSLVPGSAARTVEFRVIRKDGSETWVESDFIRLNDGSGDLLGATRIVAERKRLGEELVRALDEAKTALAVKAEFLANMTHELRTPLNAIIGFSGLLRQSAKLAAGDARQVELVWDASQTLLKVVNDVLDFSKLEAGAGEFEAHPFDPTELAQSTAALLAEQAAAKGLALEVRTEGARGLMVGDGGRLRQVLLNLLSNAVKFTTRGEIEVLVSQSAQGEGLRLRMAVKDAGIGVPAGQIDSIFGRFTQGDASVSREFGGTGLGLAICKLIIEAMGGQIGVVSIVGRGSTFWFEVPLARAEVASVSADGAPGKSPASVEQAMRLLLVDDNAVNRELIGALLAPFDLDIDIARDGVEAIDAASRGDFDLILMDVQMPVMDGLTATRRIREMEDAGGRRIPIIAMTANVLPEQVARCLEAGMDDHIGKPIDPAALIETLSRWGPSGSEAPAAPSAKRAAV